MTDMAARLEEIQQSYDTRLANMKEVIANLDEDRKKAGARIEQMVDLVGGYRHLMTELVQQNILPASYRERAEELLSHPDPLGR